MRNKKIMVNDLMQRNYVYYLTEPSGRQFDSSFNPELAPREMLELGVFGGKYMNDCRKEFPKSWFLKAKLSPEGHNLKCNYFGVRASQPLPIWQEKGWIYHEDPRGWFQWYCRYYMGRRCEDDGRQIKRWRAFKRHASQVEKNCKRGDLNCRPKQRQALLNWAYDSREI